MTWSVAHRARGRIVVVFARRYGDERRSPAPTMLAFRPAPEEEASAQESRGDVVDILG